MNGLCAACIAALGLDPSRLEAPDAVTYIGAAAPAVGDGATVMQPATQATRLAGATVPPTSPPSAPPSSQTASGVARGATGPLTPGLTFGSRYQIIKLLGSGGMGAVYQAWDEELGVIVALKVIRPEITSDPLTGPEVERRFKRELVLARQVTHKHVIRIHDLGEIDGIKYITMQFVHGQNLAAMLRQAGKLPVPEALRIGRQVAAGLAAAHEVGVVHRDLKPANIMLDEDGNALIVDFGIARSASAGATAGVVAGTLEYMSPEQAKGLASDGRSDIYSFGLILLDLLTGTQRLTLAPSTMVELMGRMREAPPPVRTVEPGVPEGVERVISNCLDPEPEHRYQTAAALAADLDQLVEGRQPAATTVSARAAKPKSKIGLPQILAAAGVIVLVAGLSLFGLRDRLFRRGASAGAPTSVSLAVLPFRNSTGDPSLDWLGDSVTEMLADDLGQTSAFRVIPSDRISRLLSDLRTSSVDDATIKRVSDLTSAGMIVSGKFIKAGGSALRLDLTLHDNARGTDTQLSTQAADQNGIADAAQQLTKNILARAASDVRSAGTVAPSSRSPAAIREYNLGLQLARDTRWGDALKHFDAATTSDATFAVAYSKAAEMHSNLHQPADAQRAAQAAVDLAPKLSQHDRYLVEARYAKLNNENDKAIAAYKSALTSSPNDTSLQLELGSLYETTGALDAAHGELERVLAADPKNLDALVASGRVEIKRKNPQGAIDPLNRALALAIQFDNEEARATILNAIGIAYKRLNRPDDALQYYQQSIEIKRRLGQKAGIAASLSEIAQIQQTKGQPDAAVKSYEEAIAIRREIGDKRGTANSLIDMGSLLNDRGRFDDALKLYREALQTERDVGDKNYEALCLNNIGNVYMLRGDYAEALTYFERALEIREALKTNADIAQTLHNIGEASSRQGQYDKALKSYVRALDLRRAAGDKRTIALESYSIGAINAYQGRYGAALKAEDEALGVLRQLKDRDSWFAEILSGYATTLCQLGRLDDAKQPLAEALTAARELKNGATIAQALTAQGLARMYAGDLAAASAAFADAQREASRAGAQRESVIAEINQAKVELAQGHADKAATALATASQKAQEIGLSYESFDAAIALAEARLASGQRQKAGADLDSVIRRSQDAGLLPLTARGHAVYADILAATGRAPDAKREYQQALNLLNQIGQESGNAELMFKRSDLEAMRRRAQKLAST